MYEHEYLYTYLFPVGTFLGLMSAALNAANISSIGEAAYECGPVNITGTLSSYKRLIVLEDT